MSMSIKLLIFEPYTIAIRASMYPSIAITDINFKLPVLAEALKKTLKHTYSHGLVPAT